MTSDVANETKQTSWAIFGYRIQNTSYLVIQNTCKICTENACKKAPSAHIPYVLLNPLALGLTCSTPLSIRKPDSLSLFTCIHLAITVHKLPETTCTAAQATSNQTLLGELSVNGS